MDFSNERNLFYSINDLAKLTVEGDSQKREALVNANEEICIETDNLIVVQHETYPLYIQKDQTIWSYASHIAPAEGICVLKDVILRKADFAIFSMPREKIFLSSVGAHRASGDADGSRVYQSFYRQISKRLVTSKIPVIVCNDGYHNYWHWHAQTMQAISRIRKFGLEGDCCYIVPSMNKWQAQCLSALGVPSEDIVEISEDVIIDKALYPSIVDPRAFLNLSPQYADLFKAVQKNLGITNEALGSNWTPKYLYVSRKDAPHRTMQHERELNLILKKFGFLEVIPSGMTYQEQAEMFSAADVVVGIHGAGLTNIGFCPKRTLIIELFDVQYMNYVYYKLARLVGCQYECVLTSAHDNSSGSSQWTPDIATIAQSIFRFMTLYGYKPFVAS